MAGRIRTVKPDYFIDDRIVDAEKDGGFPPRSLRWIFEGLWTQSDREGRFKWRPARLRTQICPYDDDIPAGVFENALEALCEGGWIRRYPGPDGKLYGLVVGFQEHQRVRSDEAQSVLPPPDADTAPDTNPSRTHNEYGAVEGKGKERKGKKGTPPASPEGEVQIVTKDGQLRITEIDLVQWQEDFPKVDVRAAVKRMAAYWREQPNSKRWTMAGGRRGVVAWLKGDSQKAEQAGAKPAPKPLDECPPVGE